MLKRTAGREGLLENLDPSFTSSHNVSQKLITIKEYAEESVSEKGKRYDVNFFYLGITVMKMGVVEWDVKVSFSRLPLMEILCFCNDGGHCFSSCSMSPSPVVFLGFSWTGKDITG